MGHSGQNADNYAFVMAIYHSHNHRGYHSIDAVGRIGSDSYSSHAVVQNRTKLGSKLSVLYLGVYLSQKAGPHFCGAKGCQRLFGRHQHLGQCEPGPTCHCPQAKLQGNHLPGHPLTLLDGLGTSLLWLFAQIFMASTRNMLNFSSRSVCVHPEENRVPVK